MHESLHHPKGTFDLLPRAMSDSSWRAAPLWRAVETSLCATAHSWGFEEIRTPIFESTSLFQRGVGDSSDIVSKEMYTFADRAGRSLTLRPEGTLGVVRAIIEKGGQPGSPQYRSINRLFYLGPMFRYERPQAGRYRQFHQFGAEIIGLSSWQSDVEVLDLAITSCKRLGVHKIQLELNSLGDAADRARFRSALTEYLQPHQKALSEDSQRRLERNPLRILDTKDPQDREILSQAPALSTYLSSASRERFAHILEWLELAQIPYVISPHLVRGLDYYCHTVFELTSPSLGAQNSLVAGGRYDELFAMLGQPARSAMGFGLGLERTIQALPDESALKITAGCEVYIIAIGSEVPAPLFLLGRQLRQMDFRVILHTEGGKVARALQLANAENARWVLLAGEEELARSGVQCRDMQARTEAFYSLETIGNHLAKERSQ